MYALRTSARISRGLGIGIHAVLVLFGHASFLAAQCVQVVDAQKCRAIGPGAIVFEATVERIEHKPLPPFDPNAPVAKPTSERLMHLRDIRTVKGTPQDVLVAPVFGSEDCSYEFRQGQRYLIVARKLDDGRLMASDTTRPIETSAGLEAYVKTLGQFAKGQLWGTVSMPERWTDWSIGYGPVSGARVTLQGQVTTQSTRTDGAGQFGFTGLPWGTYSVRVDVPESSSFLVPLEAQSVELSPGANCAELEFTAETRSQIEGVVLDERGRPAEGIHVMLHPADYVDSRGEGNGPGFGVATDSRGRYLFSNLPPARYVAGVNTIGSPLPGDPYIEAYAADATGNTVVPLGLGVRAVLQPLRLTRAIRATVSGVVLNGKGDPMVGVDVSLSWTTVRGYTRREYPRKTDNEGRFRIPAWEGLEYRLEVGAPGAPFTQVAKPSLNVPMTITVAGQ